ncbi:1535_t:CDS:2, partial [Racocetra fulgida]
MGRLKKHLLIRYTNARKARGNKKNNDKDDLPIVDNAYDLENEEAIETVFEKLIQNAYNIIFSQANNTNLNNDEITNDTNDEITDDTQSNYKSETEVIENSLQWKQKLQETEKRIQHLIDTCETSKTDKYCARCIRAWAKKCLEGNSLPLSQHKKHPSKSLLNDEYVSLRIANYL